MPAISALSRPPVSAGASQHRGHAAGTRQPLTRAGELDAQVRRSFQPQ